MSEILDGWNPDIHLQIAEEEGTPKAMIDYFALLRLKAAVAVCEERGLCLYCGSDGLPCYCRNDE